MNLTKIHRIRLSEQDIENLKKLGKKRSKFIREAFREKFEREYPKLIELQNKKLEKECPF